MQTLWKYLEDLVGKGLEWYVIAEFIFYFAIHLIPLALPLAILLSSIMVFGNLGERYELVAIKSAGVSLLRSMKPMFVISIMLAIAAFFTANYFIPRANLNWGSLLYSVTKKKPALNIANNVFYKDIDGYAIRVGKKHDDDVTIEDVLIYVYKNKKITNDNILIAEKGKMYITEDEHFMILELENGIRYQELVDDKDYKQRMPHNTMEFASYKMAIDLSELQFQKAEKNLFRDDHRMLNVKELEQKVDSLDKMISKKGKKLHRYLEPYFNLPADTLNIESSDVDARLEYLMQLSAEKGRSGGRDRAKRDSTRKQRIRPNSSIAALPSAMTPKASDVKVKLEKEEVLSRAIQNTKNIEKIAGNVIESGKDNYELKAKYLVEWHRKYTLAVSCILLFFIGAPLGAIIRKGGFGLPLVVSILLFIVYYVINVFGEKLVKQQQIDSTVGMWLSTFILFPLAIFLTYKASTDSKLFDADFYNRIARLFKRK